MDYTLSNPMDSSGLESRGLTLTMNAMDFSERFRWARARAEVTQQQIADRCGISNRTISAWERGQADGILAENLYCVADFLQVNPRWLATGQESPERESALGDAFAELPADQQQIVRTLISSLKR